MAVQWWHRVEIPNRVAQTTSDPRKPLESRRAGSLIKSDLASVSQTDDQRMFNNAQPSLFHNFHCHVLELRKILYNSQICSLRH